jgi:hypothetical protein
MSGNRENEVAESKGGSTVGFLKRMAFYWGLLLGLATAAAAGIVALTYLFTGKFPSVAMAEGEAEVQLMTSDEVVAMVREQVNKSKAAQADEGTGG